MEKYYKVMVSNMETKESFQLPYKTFTDSMQAQACSLGVEKAFQLLNASYTVFVIVEDENGNQL